MMIRQQVFASGAILLLTVALTSAANAQAPPLVENSGFISARSSDLPVPPDTTIPQFIPGQTNEQNTIISTVTITNEQAAFVNNGGNINNTFFTIEGLEHERLSDLTVRVDYFPLGTDTSTANPTRTATLFERVGLLDDAPVDNTAPPQDNGIIDNQNFDGFGSVSNFNGAYRFQDGGQSLFDTATNQNLGDDGVVPTLNSPSDGSQVLFAASGANNGEVSLFNAFAGAGDLTLPQIAGIYEFAISDRSNFLTAGSFQPDQPVPPQIFTATNVAFQTGAPTTAIPEPGTATAIVLGLIGFAARRRRA